MIIIADLWMILAEPQRQEGVGASVVQEPLAAHQPDKPVPLGG